MYTEDLFNGWAEQEEDNYTIKNGKKVYLKKSYLHFDERFWFPDQKKTIQKIVQNSLKVNNTRTGNKQFWSFSPFIKILLKTPRYKYQEAEKDYGLEMKIRPICFAAHIDGLIFSFYSYCLTRKYEEYIKQEKFDECVLAYRSDLGKSNIQFSKEVFEYIKEKGECTAISLDIKGYFDHIDHAILKDSWSTVIGEYLPEDQFRIYNVLTQYSYVNKESILRKYYKKNNRSERLPTNLLEIIPGKTITDKFKQMKADKVIVKNDKPKGSNKRFIGIPQGSPMSAILSNIYLIEYDKLMMKMAKEGNFLYRRYCDDILIVCDSEQAKDLQRRAIDKITNDYNLTIQEKKVELTEFKRNSKGIIRAFNRKKMESKGILNTDTKNEKFFYKSLQYLGFEFNGKDIFIRSSSLSGYYKKMKARIVKTVSMAYSNKSKSDKINKEQLFNRYTHLGRRNFLSYAYNASKETYVNSFGQVKEGMNSPAIRKQLRRHFDILLATLEKKNVQRYIWKQNQNLEKKKGKGQRNLTRPKII